jgi:dTMP kinase
MGASAAIPRGRFIVLDGIDGCGKSTQAARLTRALEQSRAPGRGPAGVLHLREPGGSGVGEQIRALVLSREHTVSPAVETLLFAAARRQMLDERVMPALERGWDVVCERSNASTFAYQAVAGGLPEDAVLALLRTWSNDPQPDLTLWLDLPVEEAQARRAAPQDRIEDRGRPFQEAVRRGFERWAERVPGNVRIDARGEESAVAERIWSAVRGLEGARRG